MSGGILLLLLVVLLLLASPVVQTKLTSSFLSGYFEKDSVGVSLGRLHIVPFSSVEISDLLLTDQRQDTLIYVGDLGVKISSLDLENAKFVLTGVKLANSKFHLIKYEDEKYGNIRFLLNHFSRDTTKKMGDFEVVCDNIEFVDFDFKWRDENVLADTSSMDFKNIHVSEFNAQFSQYIMRSFDISTHIDQLSLKEQCGFVLDSLSSYARVNMDSMQFLDIEVLTSTSRIAGAYTMYHNRYKGFMDYLNEVEMKADLFDSYIDFNDVAYFTHRLKEFDETVNGSVRFSGTVADFNASQLDLKVGEQSILRGEVKMKGLPKIEETYMDIVLNESYIHPKDVENIRLQAFSEKLDIQIPDFISRYGLGQLTGFVKGYYNDLASNLAVKGSNGSVSTNFTLKEINNQLTYKGHINTYGLNLGRLALSESLGKVSVNVDFDGKGTKQSDLEVSLDGKIQRIDVNGYSYNNAQIDGKLREERFDGFFSMRDSNIVFDFSGSVNFKPEKPRFQFQANIDTLYPVALRLIKRDSAVFVRANLNFDTRGITIEDFAGNAVIQDFVYQEGNKSIEVPLLKVRSYDANSVRHFDFNGSLGRGEFAGTYNRPNFRQALKNMIHNSLPNLIGEEDVSANHNFQFSVRLNNIDQFFKVFYPDLEFGQGLELRGNFDGPDNEVQFGVNSPYIKYKDVELEQWKLDLEHDSVSFLCSNTFENIQVGEEAEYHDVLLITRGENNHIEVECSNDNRSEPAFKSDIAFGIDVLEQRKFRLAFDSSYVVLADSVWTVRDSNYIEFGNEDWYVSNFLVESGEKKIKVDGTISRDTTKSLSVELVDLNMGNFSRIIGITNAEFSGFITGDVSLSRLYDRPEVSSTLYLTDLTANQQYIGSGPLYSSWNTQLKRFDVDFDVFRPADSLFSDTIRSIRFVGYYYPQVEDTSLHLTLKSDGLKMKAFEPFVSDYLGEIQGEIVGDLSLSGSIDHPVLKGDLSLQKAGFLVKYLNSRYKVDDQKIFFEEDYFGFDNWEFTDEQGHSAFATGTIIHDNWKNFNFNTMIDLNDFQVLNTSSGDNELYYGTAYLDSVVNISVDKNLMELEMYASTTNNSKLFLPLYSASEVTQNDFITFIDLSPKKEEEEEEKADLTGIKLDFNLNIKPSTEIQLVFDDATGERISAQGGGDIRMAIEEDGEFTMFGEYEIRNGFYLFNFENVMKKRFTLSQGSKIVFNGDPFNARMDVTAQYRVKAGLDQILGDSSYSKKVDNIVLLTLTDQLQKPNLAFDIDIQNVDSDVEAQVKSQMPTPEDVNKQVFSLLLFNNYTPPDNSLSGTGFVGANTAELIANQINNFLQGMDNNVINVGVSTLRSDNVEVELSKQMLDNRLIFESNVGVDNSEYNSSQGQQGQLVGDFQLEYLIREDGKVRAKVFNRTETYRIESQGNSSGLTQGVGVFYQEDFDTYKQFFGKIKRAFTPKTEEEKEAKKKQKEERKQEREEKKQARKDVDDPEDLK